MSTKPSLDYIDRQTYFGRVAGYPLVVDLEGRKCVVIGGGGVAERKVEGLLAADAMVTVVSPRLSQRLETRVTNGEIQHHRRRYQRGDLAGASLAFVATGDPRLAATVAREGRSRGVWVNAADDPEHCDFFLEPRPDRRDAPPDCGGRAARSAGATALEPGGRVSAGIVYIVGAGPGDPGLITVRGLELLRRADVVVHDRLVSGKLLDEAPPQARRVFVGKACGAHSLPQREINALLIDEARRGHRVVRLKGGDPFVFGRGGEEALALAEAGVAFEVVPGVTSAVAVPAAAGIPLTHRGLASSFAVVTGHRQAGEDEPVDWGRLARGVDTLVVVMGLANLPTIVRELIANGRDPDTPAALIERGTTEAQRTVTATLATLADAATAARLEAPVLAVIGQVVSLRAVLAG